MKRQPAITVVRVLTLFAILLGITWLGSAFWRIQWSNGRTRIFLAEGGLTVSRQSWQVPLKTWEFCRSTHQRLSYWWIRQGVLDLSSVAATPRKIRFINLPLWMPLMMTIGAAWMIHWQHRKRIMQGHCQACGYNLTGNTSGVCPECGTPIIDCPEY
jgi:hypothetical protein